MHDIDVLGCGAIYIDGERAFGSKPYGLFSTVTWKASDEDLKRISDRCLEVIADTPQTDCETCKHYDPDHEAIACERCLDGKYNRYEPQTGCPWGEP